MEELQEERDKLLTALNNWISGASEKAMVELELDLGDDGEASSFRGDPTSVMQKWAEELLASGEDHTRASAHPICVTHHVQGLCCCSKRLLLGHLMHGS